MSVRVEHGDSREVLKALADCSLSSVVTDPPYSLQTINKRFAKVGRNDKTWSSSGPHQRTARGFMGKKWDTGETAFDPAFWSEVWRVLKPGGHVLAFGGTRTYHRLVCAIEDGGFEVRDTIGWLFGSGFPKSHNVSKSIDKHGGQSVAWFGPWFRQWRKDKGISSNAVAALFPSINGGITGCVRNWELGLNLPTPEQFNLIRDTFGLPFESIEAAEREIVGPSPWTNSAAHFAPGADHTQRKQLNQTAPATDAARQWEGWGTALKPAMELICLARKPLVGTVAANVLAHGTGALNIDGCRVPANGDESGSWGNGRSNGSCWSPGRTNGGSEPEGRRHDAGRWPANVVHDGSDEVVSAFPEGQSAGGHVKDRGVQRNVYGQFNGRTFQGISDSGSAARFFYSAKADADDRLGSKHPTVKPVDLMRWLVRLITPPGGTVLDPFAGSGTTGMACMAEGFDCILIEREAEYVADIRRRIAHVSGQDAPLFAKTAVA